MSETRAAHIDEITRRGTWIPVRHELGITGFGVNAYRGDEPGDRVISDHTESFAKHEELYLVLSGRATFTVDGDEHDAPAGTLIFVGDPALQRSAVAAEPATTVLVAGAKAGAAYEVPPWDASWAAGADSMAQYREGNYQAAADLARAASESHPEAANLIYNVACFECLAGAPAETVLADLTRSIELYPEFRDMARTDSDFDPIRDDPAFQELIGEAAPAEPSEHDGPGYQITRVGEIDTISDGRVPMRPLGAHLEVMSFGVNAFPAPTAGERLVNEHDEGDTQEELYVVLEGSASFVVDDERITAPAGTLVLVAPASTRTAFAEEDGTTLVVYGGTPGSAYEPRGWHIWAPFHPLYEAGDYETLIAQATPVVEANPRLGAPLYNLACCESLAGHPDGAVKHLRQAIETSEGFREMAANDSDFDPIRGDAEFSKLVTQSG